jgi:peptidoglycan/LPS O-acetylase OafA/YrhL
MVYHSGLTRGGFLGVDMFFTLSGFLITSLMLEEHAATGTISVSAFYLRRALRLLPALFAFLAVWGIFFLVSLPTTYWSLVGTNLALVALYVANWAGIWWYGLGIFGHTWSLAIEEQFYFVWPLAILLLIRGVRRPTRIAWMLLVVAAASVIWRFDLALAGASVRRIYWGTDTHADGLLIGAALAFLVSGGRLARFSRGLAAAGRASAVALVALLAVAPQVPAYTFGITVPVALSTAVIVLDVLDGRSWLARVLETRALVGIGRISYGLYLWHFPVFSKLGALRLPGEHAPYERTALAWAATFAIALASYFLIERRALAYKDRFSRSRRAAPTGPFGDRAPAQPAPVFPIPILP